MPFELYSEVALIDDLLDSELQIGDIGTVVVRHVVPGQEDGYSVEFFDAKGTTVAVTTVPESCLRSVTGA